MALNFTLKQILTTMADLFKKLVYTGVGLVSLTSEKLQTLVNDLVDQRKLSQEEGQKIVSEFLENTEAKREEFESKLTKIVEDVVETFDFPKNTDMLDLNSRVSALEAKLGFSPEESIVEATPVEAAPKATSKKRTTRKKTAEPEEVKA